MIFKIVSSSSRLITPLNGRQRLVRLQFTGYDLILDLIDDLLVVGIRSMRFNDDYQSHVSSFFASS